MNKAPKGARYRLQMRLDGKWDFVALVDGEDRNACGGFSTAETCAAFLRDDEQNPRPVRSQFLDERGREVFERAAA